MAFSDLRANVVALFTTSVLYGMNTVTFLHCIKVFLVSNGRVGAWRPMHYIVAATAMVMFAVATVDVGVIFDRCIKISIDGVPRSTTAFAGISTWWNIVELSNTVVQTFVGGAILICRCWVLWKQRWIIALGPAITCCVGTGCGIAAAAVGSTSPHLNDAEETRPFITPFLALTLVTNVAASLLIVFCTWSVGRNSRSYSSISREAGGPFSRAIRVISEAGLLYTTAVLVLLITYSIGHSSQIIMARALVQIIGIVGNYIIRNGVEQRVSMTVAPVTMLPLGAMVINQEVIVSHDPPDKQSQRIAERSKRKGDLWKYYDA